MPASSPLIEKAEEIAHFSSDLGYPLLVIGAAALAGHRYVRMTKDLDLAANLPLPVLRELGKNMMKSGHSIDLREPDADDPLGGVLDIQGDFGQIQVISFEDRFPSVIRDALKETPIPLRKESSLRIIPLPHLVVLKLYAGGFKSKADIIEVLARNPEADLNAIESLCNQYRVSGFPVIRKELEG